MTPIEAVWKSMCVRFEKMEKMNLVDGATSSTISKPPNALLHYLCYLEELTKSISMTLAFPGYGTLADMIIIFT